MPSVTINFDTVTIEYENKKYTFERMVVGDKYLMVSYNKKDKAESYYLISDYDFLKIMNTTGTDLKVVQEYLVDKYKNL